MTRKKYFFSILGLFALGLNNYANETNMPQPTPPSQPPFVDCYISVGDNWWLGESLAVDSPASIDAAFDMLKNVLGVKRIYWRGLQAAAWANTPTYATKSYRYASFHQYMNGLILKDNIEKTAADIAHKHGIELWGVGSIADWGSSQDTPTFGDFPFEFESTLRAQHPEWIPIDKYGYRKQGGTIELAYPEARKAMIDLQTDLARKAGYDGVIFLTYAENFSTRFEDEFGYSEPVVSEFKKRYGIDITKEPFNKYASKEDWYRLRGEYLTAYLREMKESMGQYGIKVGMFLEGHNPRKPMVWATLPQMHYTFGNIYFDLETWVQQNIISDFVVYGNAARTVQAKTVNDILWLTRNSNSKVAGFVTTGLKDPNWTQFYEKNIPAVFASWEDQDHFDSGTIPHQTASALQSGTLYEKMKFLAQVAKNESTASVSDIAPYAAHENVVMRRLALLALGKLKDPAGIDVIEQGLFDAENGVRCKAMQALQYNHRPESVEKILKSLEQYGNHPLFEGAVKALSRFEPFPHDVLVMAATQNSSDMIRNTAVKVLGSRISAQNLHVFEKAISDSSDYVRYTAAAALGGLRSEDSINLLIEATRHADVVVQGRAAISLGQLCTRLNEQTLSLRPAMLDAVKTLFLQMGDGCSRPDKDYGYRMAGDALLAFGQEGEAFLNQCLEQDKDKRLTELAWRVLYYREKSGENSFNIITEKENDAAYRKRPAWLKTLRIERLLQDFDQLSPETSGLTGNVNSIAGRWAAFSDPRVMLASDIAASKPLAVRLSGPGAVLTGWNALGLTAENDYEMSFWVYRTDSKTAFSIRGKTDDSLKGPVFSLTADKTGMLTINGNGIDRIEDVNAVMIPQKWVQIQWTSNVAKKYCSISFVTQENSQTLNIKVPILSQDNLSLLEFVSEQGIIYFDNIRLSEIR